MSLLERLDRIHTVLTGGIIPACQHMRDGDPGEVFGICGDDPTAGFMCRLDFEAHLVADHILRPRTMCDQHPDRSAVVEGEADVPLDLVDIPIRTPDAWEGRFTGRVLVNPALHRCQVCVNDPSDPNNEAA
jgi:hypothetical protein